MVSDSAHVYSAARGMLQEGSPVPELYEEPSRCLASSVSSNIHGDEGSFFHEYCCLHICGNPCLGGCVTSFSAVSECTTEQYDDGTRFAR